MLQQVDPFIPIRPARHARARPPQPAPPPVQSAPEPAAAAGRHRWLRAGQYIGLTVLIIAAGILMQFVVAGEILIAAYAVVVLLRHIPSRVTFLGALGSIGYIIFMLFTNLNQTLLKNFAMYAFLLLLIGTLSLAREGRVPADL